MFCNVDLKVEWKWKKTHTRKKKKKQHKATLLPDDDDMGLHDLGCRVDILGPLLPEAEWHFIQYVRPKSVLQRNFSGGQMKAIVSDSIKHEVLHLMCFRYVTQPAICTTRTSLIAT